MWKWCCILPEPILTVWTWQVLVLSCLSGKYKIKKNLSVEKDFRNFWKSADLIFGHTTESQPERLQQTLIILLPPQSAPERVHHLICHSSYPDVLSALQQFRSCSFCILHIFYRRYWIKKLNDSFSLSLFGQLLYCSDLVQWGGIL